MNKKIILLTTLTSSICFGSAAETKTVAAIEDILSDAQIRQKLYAACNNANSLVDSIKEAFTPHILSISNPEIGYGKNNAKAITFTTKKNNRSYNITVWCNNRPEGATTYYGFVQYNHDTERVAHHWFYNTHKKTFHHKRWTDSQPAGATTAVADPNTPITKLTTSPATYSLSTLSKCLIAGTALVTAIKDKAALQKLAQKVLIKA